jgi:predicted dehydrogenase
MSWRQDATLSGLNIMSLGIWYETLMRWIGEATRVAARGSICQPTRTHPETGAGSPVLIPDHLVISAEMAGGALLSMLISNVAGGVRENTLTLYGSEGTLRFSADDNRLSIGRRGETALRDIAPPAEAPGWRVEEDFVASIREGRPVTLTSFATGVRYMAFTEAVAGSLTDGRPVEVPE